MYYILLFINYTIWHAMWHILLSAAPSLSSFGAVRIPIFRLPVMARAPAALVWLRSIFQENSHFLGESYLKMVVLWD